MTAGGLVLTGMVFSMGAANAQVTQKGGGYLFRQKFTPGQTLRYGVDSSASAPGIAMGGGSFKIQMGMSMSVLSVSNGVATVKLTRDAMSLNGKSQGKPETSTMKIDSRGQTVITGTKHGASIGPILPEKPLKIGDVFTSEGGGMTGMQGGMNVKTTYRFIGLKNYNGKRVAQFSLVSDTTGEVRGSTSGFLLYSMADGQIVSASTDTKMSMKQQGKSLDITSHTKMELK